MFVHSYLYNLFIRITYFYIKFLLCEKIKVDIEGFLLKKILTTNKAKLVRWLHWHTGGNWDWFRQQPDDNHSLAEKSQNLQLSSVFIAWKSTRI